MIEQYFQSILDLLASLPFAASSDVSLEKRGDRELLDMRLPLQKVMYAYHYQRKDGTLIFRYDNTAHHKSISTFPHHKHSQSGDVTSSEIPTLEQVLREIDELIS